MTRNTANDDAELTIEYEYAERSLPWWAELMFDPGENDLLEDVEPPDEEAYDDRGWNVVDE